MNFYGPLRCRFFERGLNIHRGHRAKELACFSSGLAIVREKFPISWPFLSSLLYLSETLVDLAFLMSRDFRFFSVAKTAFFLRDEAVSSRNRQRPSQVSAFPKEGFLQ